MEQVQRYIDDFLALPPFFIAAIVIVALGIVFSILRRVIKAAITLTLIAALILVLFVLFQK